MPLLLLYGLLLSGPHGATCALADTLVTYRDEAGRTLPDRTGAKYLVKAVRTDSLGGSEWVYDLHGLLHEHLRFAHFAKRTRHGVQEEYFDNSHQLKVTHTYEDGKLTGELRSYYPGGQLKRRERYLNYVSQGGECFTDTGAPTLFVPYLVMPEFAGGMPQLMSYLAQETRYPLSERLAGHTGRVLVSFVVDKKGYVTRTSIVQSVSPKLDAEALRVLNRMPRWKPGLLDGQVENIAFTLPVSFVLQ